MSKFVAVILSIAFVTLMVIAFRPLVGICLWVWHLEWVQAMTPYWQLMVSLIPLGIFFFFVMNIIDRMH